MAKAFAGHYPIEHRAGEIERLRIQAEAIAPDTRTMLDRIGVKPGWRCLDIGCGPGGITGLLSERVGPGGRVVGLPPMMTMSKCRIGFSCAMSRGLSSGVACRASLAHLHLWRQKAP
jgi:SAM-dependent methyltransferase